jgi:metal-responsive CopG/Arc/MetJ family transcriptional regulator
MRETLTISIPAVMRKQLSKAAKAEGVTQSEFVRQALKTELFRKSFRAARRTPSESACAKYLHGRRRL